MPDASEGPVTKIIARRIKPQRHADYEAWLASIASEATNFPGYLGVNVIRPSAPMQPEFVIILRFDSYANLVNWDRSRQHIEHLKLSDEMADGQAHGRTVTGLEFLFTPPGSQTPTPPPRYKMAIVIGSVIFVLSSASNLLLIPLLGEFPQLIRQLITVSLQIILLTYLILPFLTRVLSGWLSRS